MKRFFIVIVILATVSVAAYYVWQGREEFLFQGEESYEVNEEFDEEENGLDNLDDEEEEYKLKTEEEKKEEEERKLDDLDEEEMSLILASDCDNECEDWEDDKEEFEICQEICGLRDDSDDSNDDCDDLEDIEADICYRRKAIDEKDFSICKKIDDDSLRKNCENRVTEEILDDQN
ncbi:MAG: hypothetical protein U9O20_04110 [Patescibacteria group bacterium]|nr:hypothetical protein [Patescibacteria group bacterium]